MYSLEAINHEDILKIYQHVVTYSIHRYQELPDSFKEFYKSKYENALNLKVLFCNNEEINKEDCINYLNNAKEVIKKIETANQPVIEMLSEETLNILKSEKPESLDQIKTCEYLFDYITNTMSYSDDWFNYCSSIPPIDGYNFDFYHGIPISTTYNGLLTTRQGSSLDIANLFTYLGREFNLKIETVFCKYNNLSHAINYIEFENGNISLMDPTNIIRKKIDKDSAFLVSENTLTKDGTYTFHDGKKYTLYDKTSVDINKNKEKTYDISEVVYKTNSLIPTTNYIQLNQKELPSK